MSTTHAGNKALTLMGWVSKKDGLRVEKSYFLKGREKHILSTYKAFMFIFTYSHLT